MEEPGGFIEAARLAARLAASLVEGGAVFTIWLPKVEMAAAATETLAASGV